MIQKQEAESKDKPEAIVNGEHPEGVRSTNGADTTVPITGEPTPGINDLMAQVLSKTNLLLAYKQVVSNKGAPGLDGMKVVELKPYLQTNWHLILVLLVLGFFVFLLFCFVELPKPGSGVRMF